MSDDVDNSLVVCDLNFDSIVDSAVLMLLEPENYKKQELCMFFIKTMHRVVYKMFKDDATLVNIIKNGSPYGSLAILFKDSQTRVYYTLKYPNMMTDFWVTVHKSIPT